ncbi:MAG: GNAT family N-acetyltransferase [Gammaproteobacteria bacterium]
MIEIKHYNDCNKQQIIEMILEIQNNEFNIPFTLKDQPDLESIASFYQINKGNFWVALHDDKVIGTIALIDIGRSQAALRKMFVAKEFRGNEYGIAHKLLSTLIEWCRSQDIQEVYLGTVSILLAAQRFYLKNGFNEIDKQDLPASFPLISVDTKFYCLKI